MSEAKPKKRNMTPKTRLLVVTDAKELTGVGVDDTVGTLIAELEKAALYEIYTK